MSSLICLSPNELYIRVHKISTKHVCTVICCFANSETPSRDLTSKSMFHTWRFLTHPKAFNKARASPLSTSVKGENHSVRASTKPPSSSLIQIPIPTLSRGSEKDASTLHLYLPGDGLVHFSTCLVTYVLDIRCLTSWALVQLASSALALFQIAWHASDFVIFTVKFVSRIIFDLI